MPRTSRAGVSGLPSSVRRPDKTYSETRRLAFVGEQPVTSRASCSQLRSLLPLDSSIRAPLFAGKGVIEVSHRSASLITRVCERSSQSWSIVMNPTDNPTGQFNALAPLMVPQASRPADVSRNNFASIQRPLWSSDRELEAPAQY